VSPSAPILTACVARLGEAHACNNRLVSTRVAVAVWWKYDALLVRVGVAGLRRGRGALSRAPHRTGALAHGLADIWLTKPDRGHWAGARDGADTGVAECGKYDARILACENPSQ
jgi:hypothetical protein